MKDVKAYQCSYCKFFRKTKSIVKTHEDNCFYNPKLKACASCKHNVMATETVYDRNHGGDTGSTDYDISYHWCEKKEVELKKGTLKIDCGIWEGVDNE